MELIKILLDKLFKLKSWKQIIMMCFFITYLLLVVLIFENRNKIFKKFDIPQSKVEYVQKDLEIESIIQKMLLQLEADRVYLVQFRPRFGEDNFLEEIDVYITHEQVASGVKTVNEIYGGRLIPKFKLDWEKLFYERNLKVTKTNSSSYPYLEYHMDKSNTDTFILHAIYSEENEVTHALVMEFSTNKVFTEMERDLVRKYLNILNHYLK